MSWNLRHAATLAQRRDSANPHETDPYASGITEPLLWAGFRPLSDREAHTGPFASPDNEQEFVRLDAARLNVASLIRLRDEADLVRFLDQQERHVWGYDLNLGQHAHCTTIIHELRFVISEDERLLASELACFGYASRARSWLHCDRDCTVPDLGPDFTAPIYPCLGWVPVPGSTGEFGVAEQHAGFCSTIIPSGARFSPGSRGYIFIHGDYPRRRITRQRIITIVDPASAPVSLAALVESALALTYGES